MRRKCTDEEIVQCFKNGQTLTQIAKNLGCSSITVKKVLKENNLLSAKPFTIKEITIKLESENISKYIIEDKYLEKTTKEMAEWFSKEIGVQISESMAYNILKHYGIRKHINSLLYVNDERAKLLMSEWDEEKNEEFDYSTVSVLSSRKFWWKCSLGHSWQAALSNRYKAKAGCHVCTGREILQGFNDLLFLRPEIADEWNYQKNDKRPEEFTESSGNSVWWICDQGHEWEARISNRTKSNKPTGCPYCSNQKVLAGVNDLLTLFPQVAEEWHPVKNSLKSDKVFARTNKQVWWLGKCGHEWNMRISDRTLSNNGCPYCSGKRILKGFNDLGTLKPSLLLEWDYEKNKIDPQQISAGRKEKVWWKCTKGHSWDAFINERTNGHGCPLCSGRRFVSGVNDLATRFPHLIIEWDFERNKFLPSSLSANSFEKVWWKCSVGHSWQTQINYRTHGGTKCPTCFLSGVSQMEQDLTKVVEALVKDKSAVQNNSRKIIPPKELDIYLPDLNIAIEFNGNYWHSDDVLLATYNMTADEYHTMKRTMCEDKGITLFFVWEHDWCNFYEEVVEALEQVINHHNFVSPLLSKTSYDMELTFQ